MRLFNRMNLMINLIQTLTLYTSEVKIKIKIIKSLRNLSERYVKLIFMHSAIVKLTKLPNKIIDSHVFIVF